MELHKTLNDNLSILRVSGNSRFRILNDFENRLIDKQYIEIAKGYNPSIYLTVNHNNSLNRLCTGSVKKYIKFDYKNKIPTISIIWEFDEFTPSYVIYPIYPINPETCSEKMYIDFHEKEKNNKIMDKEIHNYYENPKKIRRKFLPIISRYGTFIKLMPDGNNIIIEDYEQKIDEFD